MRKEATRAVIRDYALPSQEVSAYVLRAISRGKLELCEFLPAKYQRRLANVAEVYKSKLGELGGCAKPKNLPFYLIVRDRYPGMYLREVDGQMQLEGYFHGMKPTLLSLLLGMVPIDHLAPTADLSLTVSENEAIAAQCREVFSHEGACAVADPDLIAIVQWIRRGKEGQPLSIVSPVCPDYAAEATEGGQFRYTFRGINSGIGVAGQRLYKSVSALHALFRERLGLTDIKHYVYVGDFEGFSEENLRRIGITEAEFAVKTMGQRDTLQQQAPVPIAARLFSELCAGKTGWLQELSRMRLRFASGEFDSLLDRQLIRDIAQERRSLYRRWFGKERADDPLVEGLVTLQVAEYAAVGDIVARRSCNPLIIGAGSDKLLRFYGLAARLPILCLKAENI